MSRTLRPAPGLRVSVTLAIVVVIVPALRPDVAAAQDASQPVRVGGAIKEPAKLKDVRPVYPAMAKQAGVQGLVILECLVSPQGRVASVKPLRGPALLTQAAIEAVRQWSYAPTIVDGVAVPILLTVTVNFKAN
jgi:protein TonB